MYFKMVICEFLYVSYDVRIYVAYKLTIHISFELSNSLLRGIV